MHIYNAKLIRKNFVMSKTYENIFYAPNVRWGGGRVLLEQILLSKRKDIVYFLHTSLKEFVTVNNLPGYFLYFTSSLSGRIYAEILLFKLSNSKSIICCFHNLPPLFPNNAKNYIFFQNLNIVSRKYLIKGKDYWRSVAEFIYLKFCSRSADKFFCQTPTVKRTINHYLNREDDIIILPFLYQKSKFQKIKVTKTFCSSVKGLIYISDGALHKNHENLAKAINLVNKKFKLTLTVTLSEVEYNTYYKSVSSYVKNIGFKEHKSLLHSLKNYDALIFPSYIESFGLPLLEARENKLPIIAPELDYVRDVCNPTETFNPSSPNSISRAIFRFYKTDFQDLVFPLNSKDALSKIFD